jgi:ABC-2 type transport system permease protein
MHNLYYILQKEFLLIFRDKTILRLVFVMPVMQLLLIPLAADYEVKHIAIAIVDQDHSSDSQRLVQKVGASTYFRIAQRPALGTPPDLHRGDGSAVSKRVTLAGCAYR